MVSVVDPQILERTLRERLSGCKLVCEAGIDSALHADLIAAMQDLRDDGIADDEARLRMRYTALVVAFLVAEGVYNYHGGNYWPNLSVKGLRQQILGALFERGTRRLGLEPFESLAGEGQRYVTPILAHGGIPRYCLGDFFRLLLDELRRGAPDASEVLARWRRTGSQFAGIDRPVVRFLLHGGDASLDLLDRCIDMVRLGGASGTAINPDAVGLPAYICDAYEELDLATRRAASARTGPAVPAPVVRIDPWSCLGPTLLLPGVSRDLLGGNWTIVGSGMAVRYDARREDREILLSPAREWSVDFAGPSGSPTRAFVYPALGRADVLCFNCVDGRLAADPRRLRASDVWLLFSGSAGRPTAANGGALRLLEHAPAPTAKWEGWELCAFDLAGTEQVVLNGSTVVLDVGIRPAHVALQGATIDGVTVDGRGTCVYGSVPTLRVAAPSDERAHWRVLVEHGTSRHQFDARDVAALGERLLEHCIPPDVIFLGRIVVRGSLGADYRSEIAVVPNLAVGVPPGLLVPGSPPVHVTASAFGKVTKVPIPRGADSASVTITDAVGEAILLRVVVPALQWCIWADGGEPSVLDQAVVRVTTRGILAGDQTSLMVRSRRQGLALQLELRNSQGEILQTVIGRTGGDEGRWSFDLRPFASAIRESGESLVALYLKVGIYDVLVVELRSEVEVKNIRISEWTDSVFTRIGVTFEEARPLRGRIVRLWPLSQPWLAPLQELIPDDATGSASLIYPSRKLPPGVYLIQIAVDSGWIESGRPKRDAPGTAEFRIGAPYAERLWAEDHSDTDPLGVLTRAYMTGSLSMSASGGMVQAVGKEAWSALATAAEYSDWSDAERQQLAVAAFLAMDPRAAGEALILAVAGRLVSASQALAASLAVIATIQYRQRGESCQLSTEGLWEVCPPLALAIQLATGAESGAQWLLEQLGIEGHALEDCQIFPHEKALMPFVQMDACQLDGLRLAANLLPRRILDTESQAAVQFDWLGADRQHRFSARDWAAANHRFADVLPALPGAIEHRFRTMQPKTLVAAFGREIEFPAVVFAASLHLAAQKAFAFRAAGALQDLAEICPGIVSRSVTLAVALLHWPSE